MFNEYGIRNTRDTDLGFNGVRVLVRERNCHLLYLNRVQDVSSSKPPNIACFSCDDHPINIVR